MPMLQFNVGSRRPAPVTLVALIVAVVVSTTGCGGGPSGRFDTPESTLNTLKTAGMNRDFATFTECLSEDCLNEMSGQLRIAAAGLQLMGSMATMMGGEEGARNKALAEKVDAITKKHVSAEAPAVNVMSMMGDAEANRAKAREAGQAVADKKAFVAEFMQLMTAQVMAESSVDYELTSMKTEGDVAIATVKDPKSGQEGPIKLRRIAAEWKVDDLGGMGGPPGPGVNAGVGGPRPN